MNNTILQMKGISKSFTGTKALQNVDFSLEYGEVHALMGENGAGKSTLMKCLAGIYSIDAGEIFFEGKPIKIANVVDSLKLGIGFIQQELVLADQITVAEIIFMGREPLNKFGVIDRKKMFSEAQQLIDRLKGKFNVHMLAGELSTAQKQIVEIAKALSLQTRIIIMDEPTAVLTQREVDQLFEIIEDLKKNGISVVYISHRMDEIFVVSDRITVLRDGKLISTQRSSEITEDDLIRMMVGHELSEYYGKRNGTVSDEAVLEVQNISRADGKAKDISFNLKKGEILGFSGLIGAGRTETMQMLFGITPIEKGKVLLEGKEIKIANPAEALKMGIGLVPEDRKMQGLVLGDSVRFNLTLTVLEKFMQILRLDKVKENEIARGLIDQLHIKIASPEQKVYDLSGGNQQKISLAKWLAAKPFILILDEPTRGIDVGAKAEIYDLMHSLADQGISIILVSSEMPELINMCDRIYVMAEGTIRTCLEKDEVTQETILRYALGVTNDGKE